MAKKGGLVAAFDNLPWIVKLIFALPGLDFIWGIYRVIKGLSQGKLLMTIIGFIWIFVGAAIFWIIDIICVILYKKPTVCA